MVFQLIKLFIKSISEGLYIVSKTDSTFKFPKRGTFRYIFFDFLSKTSNFFYKTSNFHIRFLEST